ncbi:hypothetical protein JTE90_017775 [Oedothorax gibbosus]|uniref:EIF3CL-like C-terminal domain-containing protein n=1 Tax=Oedothorax gibbosus TaxID=931172 RepID=A0AAV6UNU3_9ARAC|nr:hypothetical protein JTE90_017775 [Oedothorax gibbosus]
MVIFEQASLDEPTQSVMLHRTEPSRIQALSLQLADKVSSLVEQNERLLDLKQGQSYFGREAGPQRQGRGTDLHWFLWLNICISKDLGVDPWGNRKKKHRKKKHAGNPHLFHRNPCTREK